jgi:hypothetical protein
VSALKRLAWRLHLVPEPPRYRDGENLLEKLDRHIKELESIAMFNPMSSGGHTNLYLLREFRRVLRTQSDADGEADAN